MTGLEKVNRNAIECWLRHYPAMKEKLQRAPAEPQKLEFTRRRVEAIEQAYAESEPMVKRVMEEMYFNRKHFRMVSFELYLSDATIYRYRKQVVESVAAKLGLEA